MVLHACRERSRQTDSRSMSIAATAEQRSERAGKGNEAVRVSGVGFSSSSSLSLLLPGSLNVWAEGTALKAAWVSGDPLRRNAKSNVGATLAADAVTRVSQQGPQECAGDFYARAYYTNPIYASQNCKTSLRWTRRRRRTTQQRCNGSLFRL